MKVLPSRNWAGFACRCGLAIVIFSGCGRGPQVVPVSGRVTVNGQPMQETQVIFQPEGGQGSPSYGFTDSEGKYELSYKRGQNGALVGWHKISLEMDTEVVGTNGEYVRRRQLIPPQYNKDSELRREVKSNEKNVFDFAISSDEK